MVKLLVHLDKVPIDSAVCLALLLGGFGAHRRPPNQVTGPLAPLRCKIGPVNGALPRLELRASAFHGDAV